MHIPGWLDFDGVFAAPTFPYCAPGVFCDIDPALPVYRVANGTVGQSALWPKDELKRSAIKTESGRLRGFFCLCDAVTFPPAHRVGDGPVIAAMRASVHYG